MKKLTLNDLNNTIWYRLIKLLFVLTFILLSIVAIITSFENVGNHTTDYKIICNYGNKNIFLAYKDKNIYLPYNYNPDDGLMILPDNTKKILQETCEISYQELKTIYDTVTTGQDNNKNLFTITQVKSNVYTILHAVSWSFFAIIIIGIFFEIIRRAFYYVILGSIKPEV